MYILLYLFHYLATVLEFNSPLTALGSKMWKSHLKNWNAKYKTVTSNKVLVHPWEPMEVVLIYRWPFCAGSNSMKIEQLGYILLVLVANDPEINYFLLKNWFMPWGEFCYINIYQTNTFWLILRICYSKM